MAQDEKRVPAVRFKGFTDAWEQRKLGDMLIINSGRDYKHLDLGDIPVYGTGGYMLSVNDKLSNNDAIGIGRKGTINKPQLLKAPFWTVDTLFYMTPKNKNNLLFLYNLVNKIRWKKYDESTGVPSLSKSTIQSININKPKLEEQIKIGTFFNQLEETIALHQRKLNSLKQMKKGFMQVMFPKKEETVPKLRFASFNTNWEEYKLKDLVKVVVREVPKPNKPYTRISIRSHAKGTFHQKVEDPDTISMEKLYVVRENDLIVNITFAWEHAIAVATKDDDGLLVSHRFPTFIINQADIKFVHYTVAQETFRRKLELISPGGAGRNRVLNKKDFINLKVITPNQNEQTRIGKFLKTLDTNIELHQIKLEKLQLLKKVYLQKFFT